MRLLVSIDKLCSELNANYSGLTAAQKNEYRDYIIQAGMAFQAAIHRDISLHTGTIRYFNGNGSNMLTLPHYPIISNESAIKIYVDSNRVFGTSTKINSSNLFVNQRSGIIIILSGVFTAGTKNIKVEYSRGFSVFEILANGNNYIDVNEGSGAIAVNITEGDYTGAELAAVIQQALNGNASLSSMYAVVYNKQTFKFTISASGNFSLLWSTGTDAAKTIGNTIGFNVSADDSEASEYEADYSRSGIPADAEKAILQLASIFYLDSKSGEARLGIESKETGHGGVTTKYEKKYWPLFVYEVIKLYKYDADRRNADL